VKTLIGVLIAAILGTGALVGSASPAGASPTTTCTSGLGPGTFHTVVVPTGEVCLAFGPITIKGGLFVGPGATFVLGDENDPVHTGTINGGVHATDALAVQIHFSTINGGVDIHGGSGSSGPPFGGTWNTIEDSRINGGATIDGYNGFWMGFIRNHVNGTVNLQNNVVEDPDGNEYVTNVIHGNLNCSGNSPAPQVGDSEGSANQVTGNKTGQCADL